MSLAPGSHGLWAATAPPAPDGAPLAGAHQADVVVVGAGYTGLSAALHLAEGGANVVVLEAQDIGFGGSGRNVGLVNAGMWVLPSALPDALGPVHGERLLRLLGDAPAVVFDLVRRHGMACEAEHRGTLHCAVGAAGLKNITERAAEMHGGVLKYTCGIPSVDPGADERNERGRADREAHAPRRDVVPHLVHEDQQHEADCVAPAEDQRVREHRQDHGACRYRDLSEFRALEK
mgnify:CR=1 FL=1